MQHSNKTEPDDFDNWQPAAEPVCESYPMQPICDMHMAFGYISLIGPHGNGIWHVNSKSENGKNKSYQHRA